MQSTQQTPSPLSPLSSPQQSNESVNSNNSNVKSDPFDLNSAAIIPRPSSLGLNQMSLGTSTHNESTSNESSNDESNNHNPNSAQTADHNQAPQNDNCDESAPSPRDSANVKRESMRQQQPPQSQPMSAPIDDHQMHAQLPPQFRSSGSYQHHPYPHHHVPPPPMPHPHAHQHPHHHPYLPLQPSYHQSFAIQYSPFSGPRTPLHAQPPPPHFAQAQQPRSNMHHHHHHHHHPQFPPNPFAHSNGTGSNGHKPITMATSTTATSTSSTTPKPPVSSAPNSNDEQQLSSQSSSQTNHDEEHQQLPEEEVADADKKLVPANHFQPLLFPPMLNNGLPMLQRAPSLIANNTNSNVINEDDIFGNNHTHNHTHNHNHNHNHSNSHYHQQQQFASIMPEPLHNASAAGVPPLPPPPPPMGNCNRMPSVTPNMIFNFNYYAPNILPMPAGIPPIPDIYTQALPQQQQQRRSDSVTSKSSRDSKESSHRLILKQKRKSSPKKAADRKRKRKSPRKHVRKHVSYPSEESGEEEEEGVEADIERGKRDEYDAEYFEEMDEGVAVEEYEFDEEDEAAYQQAEAEEEGESFASAPPAVKRRKLCRDKPSNTNRNGSRKEERHICSYCQKSFVHNCHLARHIREKHVTSPLRPAFECRICDKVFNQRSNLKVHLRSHALDESVSRPWLCQQCYPNRRFTRKSSLKRHWTKKHKAVAKRLIAELDLAEAQAEAEAEAAENFDDTHQSDVKEEIVSIKHEPITVHDLSVPPEVFYSLPPHDNSLPPPLIG